MLTIFMSNKGNLKGGLLLLPSAFTQEGSCHAGQFFDTFPAPAQFPACAIWTARPRISVAFHAHSRGDPCCGFGGLYGCGVIIFLARVGALCWQSHLRGC